jgi:Protein of unknown function (DUF1670)
MGRSKRYRQRVRFELESVVAKSLRGLLTRTLTAEFGCNRVEAEALAIRALEWLPALGAVAAPGRARLWVPATRSKRLARVRRRAVLISAVEVGEDTAVWEAFGLAALQRRRLLRWMDESCRQGGCASLAELAAWANLTPTALGARLAPVRRLGVWLPHVGGPEPDPDRLGWEAWLVDRYLADGLVEAHRALLGVTVGGWEALLRRFVAVVEQTAAGIGHEQVAATAGRASHEVAQFQVVARRHRRGRALAGLRAAYGGAAWVPAAGQVAGVEAELAAQFGFSAVSARAFRWWLAELAGQLGGTPLGDGELVFFAISADEGARAQLAEARQVPVRLGFFTDADAQTSCHGLAPTRVAELKFARLLRWTSQAHGQGALLTLPDLAVLSGISVDAVRRQLAAHPEVVVPTRGRVKDIGRGLTHKTQIVELYLQLHTETEICERTGHSYASVEAYLREFARMVTLADQGLNQVMIRRVTGRSMALVGAYLELYRRYDTPEYHFRLAQLRNVFARDELLAEKRGPALRSRTRGARR